MGRPKKENTTEPKKPPSTALSGTRANPVIKLNLEQQVLKLHEQGMGRIRMAKYLTNEVLPEGQSIGHSSIQRYLESMGLTNVPKQNFAINVYTQERLMLDTVNDLIEDTTAMIEALREDIIDGKGASNVKDFQALATTQEKLVARASLLSSSIGAMQEKVYNYQAVNTIVTKILNYVQQEDVDMFHRIKEKINKDPMLAEAFRKILPDNAK
jgi:hypothetical protein